MKIIKAIQKNSQFSITNKQTKNYRKKAQRNEIKKNKIKLPEIREKKRIKKEISISIFIIFSISEKSGNEIKIITFV